MVRRKIEKENLNPASKQKDRSFRSSSFLIDDKGEKHEVCQSFLLKLLQVPRVTLYRAVASVDANPKAIDKRGKYPSRKCDARDIQFIKNFISQLTVYETKFNRSASSEKYLHPGLNVTRLYTIYKEICRQMSRKVLSKTKFIHIFKTGFSLKVYKVNQICQKCKSLNAQLDKKVISVSQKSKLIEEREKHLTLVKQITQEYQHIIEKSQDPTEQIVLLTFDLGPPIDIPPLRLDQDFTKRRLWLHNLRVFDEVRNLGYIYVWPETTASKSSEEIGSCLIRHFIETLPKDINQLVLYSQSCHGRYRNAKLSLLIKKFLNSCTNTELKTIEQRFFIDGHTYNNCDQFFEPIKNITDEIFAPSDWLNAIKRKNSNIILNVMQTKDFLSSIPLQNLISSKKNSDADKKIKWHTFQKIIFEKENPFGFKYNTYDNPQASPNEINFRKKTIDVKLDVFLPVLYPRGRLISQTKYNDLQSLLVFVPTTYHSFYADLKYKRNDDDKDYALCERESSEEEEENE